MVETDYQSHLHLSHHHLFHLVCTNTEYGKNKRFLYQQRDKIKDTRNPSPKKFDDDNNDEMPCGIHKYPFF